MWTSMWPNAARVRPGRAAGVVHVEHRRRAVRDDDPGVADRPSAGARSDDHDVQITLWGRSPGCLTESGLEEPVEAQRLQVTLEVGTGKSGSSTTASLLTWSVNNCGVEVVLVQVRDAEVVASTQRVPVQAAVVGKDEPRGEAAGGSPTGRTECSPAAVSIRNPAADAGDLHKSPSRE